MRCESLIKLIYQWLVGHSPVTWHDVVMWPKGARHDMLLSVWQYGGRLVKINDEATNEFIVRTLNGLWWRNRGVWIGLHDRHVELRWQWVGKTRCKHIHTYIYGALKTIVSRRLSPQWNSCQKLICLVVNRRLRYVILRAELYWIAAYDYSAKYE